LELEVHHGIDSSFALLEAFKNALALCGGVPRNIAPKAAVPATASYALT
jgi:hypothetical protein